MSLRGEKHTSTIINPIKDTLIIHGVAESSVFHWHRTEKGQLTQRRPFREGILPFTVRVRQPACYWLVFRQWRFGHLNASNKKGWIKKSILYFLELTLTPGRDQACWWEMTGHSVNQWSGAWIVQQGADKYSKITCSLTYLTSTSLYMVRCICLLVSCLEKSSVKGSYKCVCVCVCIIMLKAWHPLDNGRTAAVTPQFLHLCPQRLHVLCCCFGVRLHRAEGENIIAPAGGQKGVRASLAAGGREKGSGETTGSQRRCHISLRWVSPASCCRSRVKHCWLGCKRQAC